MALDVYVGPLSRFHALNWKNIGQQAAEAAGIPYQIVRPEEDDPISPEEVEEAVRRWQLQLIAGLADQGIDIPAWDEGQSLAYVTDRPGWEGMYGLIMKGQSLADPQIVLEEQMPDIERISEHPAVVASQSIDSPMCVLGLAELWFPGDFGQMFQLETVSGANVVAASISDLIRLLVQICDDWGKDPASLVEERPDQPASNCRVDEAAEYGLAVFLRLAYQAQKMSMPMILDY